MHYTIQANLCAWIKFSTDEIAESFVNFIRLTFRNSKMLSSKDLKIWSFCHLKFPPGVSWNKDLLTKEKNRNFKFCLNDLQQQY